MSQARAFTAIYISTGISYLGVGLVAPLIALVLKAHGVDSFMVGLVGSTMFAAFTLASFPIGKVTDQIGPKPVLVAGLAVYALSILLFAFIDTPLWFFLVRALEGVGGAAISVATETMINQLSPPSERGRRMSYYALSVGLGWAAGPLAGAFLFGIRHEIPFIACAIFSLAAAGLAALFIPKTGASSHHVQDNKSGLFATLAVPMSAGGLYGYLMSSLITLIPIYLYDISVTEKQMGAIITAVIVGTLLSQVPIGRAADRFGKRQTLLVCAGLLAFVFAAMTLHADWRLFLLTGASAGALAGSFYPVALAMIGESVSVTRLGAATSVFSLAFGIGSLVGPSVSGLAMTHLGNRWLFYLPSLLSVFFVIEVVALYKKGSSRKTQARHEAL